ncbi:MAG: hypothetical protein IJK87_05430 [Prevotella sp.]|nr:hypothetical protein [Prevotella sp.]
MEIAINNSIYQQAQTLAQQQGQSLNAVIENFLVQFIGNRQQENQHQFQIHHDDQTETAKVKEMKGLSPRVMRFIRGNPWYITDEETDKIRTEHIKNKYK